MAAGEVAEWSKANDSKSFEGKPSVGSNPTLSASKEFSKGLVRPDPLLYQGFLRVGRPGKSAYNQGRRKSLLGYFSNAFVRKSLMKVGVILFEFR